MPELGTYYRIGIPEMEWDFDVESGKRVFEYWEDYTLRNQKFPLLDVKTITGHILRLDVRQIGYIIISSPAVREATRQRNKLFDKENKDAELKEWEL